MTTIAELEAETVVDEVEFTLVEKKTDLIETSRFTGTMARCKGQDHTGTVKVTLWGDQVDEFQVGDRVRIINGWVRVWQEEKILTKGKGGTIRLLHRPGVTPDPAPATVEVTRPPVQQSSARISPTRAAVNPAGPRNFETASGYF